MRLLPARGTWRGSVAGAIGWLAAARLAARRPFLPPRGTAAPPPCHAMQSSASPAGEGKAEKRSQDEPSAPWVAKREAAREAKRRRKETAARCPACGQSCMHLPKLDAHLRRCCPDLVQLAEGEWAAAVAAEADNAVTELLGRFTAEEDRLRERFLDLAFREQDEDGNQLKRGADEVGAMMGLPEQRAVMMMKRAMQAVPLAVDYDPVEVLYEDDRLVAVNKPPGVSTAPNHRFSGGSMVNRMIGYLGTTPYVCHRLDQMTSGVLLFAKDKEAVATVHRAFASKDVQKTYLSIAVGCPTEQSFTVDAAIEQDPREKVARMVREDGKPAVTDCEVVASNTSVDISPAAGGRPAALMAPEAAKVEAGAALVRCSPRTGRTHQIRVHMAHVGHPLVGDDLYGLEGPWVPRQALHAATLELKHPATGESLKITAPLPEDMRQCLKLLQIPFEG